ncbi:MAG: response regulator, partial [Candidatus Eremiobacteraeota bacterium]|nr:response regulator [Candidatus Eremiobacteraeota bacterium]
MPARILVVDDNRANLDLMVYLLRAFGHTADPCVDGIAGEHMAKNASYDLILTDILMPGIDGYELARRLRAEPHTERIPLIAVSALAMVGDRERILSGGFDGYVAKPIDPETFVAQVDGFLPREWRSKALAAPATTAEAAPASAGAGPVILAVDDETVNLDVIEGALAPFGYRVMKAANVREALAAIEHVRPA